MPFFISPDRSFFPRNLIFLRGSSYGLPYRSTRGRSRNVSVYYVRLHYVLFSREIAYVMYVEVKVHE